MADLQLLRGELPSDGTEPLVAALALEASSLIAANYFWWPLSCGYRWGTAGGSDASDWNLARFFVGLDDSPFTRLTYRFERGPVPASVYAALAVVRSGADPAFVRASGPVPVAGLFALPLDSARAAGFNPWAMYDSLRFVRGTIESQINAWVRGYVPAPACLTLEDYLYSSLFVWLAGSAAAMHIFGQLQAAGRHVTMWSVTDLVRWSQEVDWAGGAFVNTTEERVVAAAEDARRILLASRMVEGFRYAWIVGLDSSEARLNTYLGALPLPPVDANGRQSFVFAFPTAALTDPEGAARTSVVDYPLASGRYPAAVAALRSRIPAIEPWESSESSLAEEGVDGWQRVWLRRIGHYLTRHSVLSNTVPGFLRSVAEGGGADEVRPVPRPPAPAPPATTRTPARRVLWGSAVVLALGIVATVVVVARRRRRK